jgi:drug/metabolite transporter (DMT)-like permease
MLSATVGISIVGTGVAVSDQLTDYPVLSAQAVRYALGAALLAAVAAATGRHEPRLTTAQWIRLVATASMGMALFNLAIVRAVTTGEPAVVGTIVGLAPVGMAVAIPLLEGRPPQTGIVGGAFLAAGGAAVVQGFGRADLAALTWSSVALGCEVAFTVLAAPLLDGLSPLGLSTRLCAVASPTLLLAAVLLDGSAGFARPDWGETLAIGYLAVGSTALAFVLWYRAVAHLGAERAGLFAAVMPVSAAVAGMAVATAPLEAGTVAGTLLTAIGLAVGLTSRPKRPAAAEEPRVPITSRRRS